MRLYFPKDSNFELGYRSEIVYQGSVSTSDGSNWYLDLCLRPFARALCFALDGPHGLISFDLLSALKLEVIDKDVKEMQKTRLKKRFYGVPDTIRSIFADFTVGYPAHFFIKPTNSTSENLFIKVEINSVYLDIDILSCVKEKTNIPAQNPSKLG